MKCALLFNGPTVEYSYRASITATFWVQPAVDLWHHFSSTPTVHQMKWLEIRWKVRSTLLIPEEKIDFSLPVGFQWLFASYQSEHLQTAQRFSERTIWFWQKKGEVYQFTAYTCNKLFIMRLNRSKIMTDVIFMKTAARFKRLLSLCCNLPTPAFVRNSVPNIWKRLHNC